MDRRTETASDIDVRTHLKRNYFSHLDEPGSPLHEQILAEAVDEPLVPEKVAGHVDVPVVKQDAGLFARSHDGLVKFDRGGKFAIVAGAHGIATQRPVRQMGRDVQC